MKEKNRKIYDNVKEIAALLSICIIIPYTLYNLSVSINDRYLYDPTVDLETTLSIKQKTMVNI